ncbi:8071_t:CDS:2, partial [Paraglomus brasilianum]
MEVYILSHDPWTVQVVHEHAAEKMISDMLQNTICDVPDVITLVWEDVLLKTDSSEVIKLPAPPTGLFEKAEICRFELKSIGALLITDAVAANHDASQVALKNLLMSLSTTIFTCYSAFVSSPSFAKVSEKSSVQMSNDASQAGNKHEEEIKLQREHYNLVNNVLTMIKGK